jgi:hypothetical protein
MDGELADTAPAAIALSATDIPRFVALGATRGDPYSCTCLQTPALKLHEYRRWCAGS